MVVVFILLFSFLSIKTYNYLKHSIITSTFAHLERKTNRLVSHINSFIELQKDIVELIAFSPIVKDTLASHDNLIPSYQEKLHTYLQEITKISSNNILEILISDKNGKTISSTVSMPIKNTYDDLSFINNNNKEITIRGPYFSKRTKDYYINLSSGVYNKDDIFIGTVTVKTSLKNLFILLTDSANLRLKEESYIINKKGIMITPSKYLKEVILRQKVNTPNTANFIKNLPSSQQLMQPFINYRNALVYGLSKEIKELNWLCIAEVDKNELLKPIYKIMVKICIMLIILTIILIFTIYYFFTDFYKTLETIKIGTKNIEEGVLDKTITENNLGELNFIAQSFNRTTQILRDTKKVLADTQSNLAEKIKEKTVESENAKKAALSLMQDANMEKETTKYTLRKLQYANEKMRNLSQAIEQSPIIVLITDKNANIFYTNPKITEVTGYTKEEIQGKSLDFIINQEKNSETYLRVIKKISEGETWKGIFENHKKNGERYWERASITPVFNESGEIINYIIIKEDITLRRQYEEALKESKKNADSANKAKSDFLRNINHEIRNPMNAIIGMTHLALNSNLPEKEQGYITKIQDSAEALVKIVNDILDYSKFEADNIEINKTEFILNDILDNISNILAIKAREKNIEFLYKINPETPQYFKGDPVRISQILLNLTSNAIKFTHKGHVIINIDIVSQSNNKIVLSFSVSDTGIGLTKTEIEKLFNAFMQADNSTTREYDGTGLGLYISQKIIKKMNGEIKVTSEKDKGSTFFFTIELDLVTKMENTTIQNKLKDLKILAVDKNPITLEILQSTLTYFSAKTTTCISIEETIKILKQKNDFDLIITNLELADGGADQLLKYIKENNLLQKAKIIIASGRKSSTLKEKINTLNIADVIYKPFTISTLIETINKCLFRISS